MPPDRTPVAIVALVAADERETILGAARRLSHCLDDAQGGSGWPVRLHFAGPDVLSPGPSAALIASLRADDDLFAAPVEVLAARWAARVAEARAAGHATILMPTLFRHVADAATRPERIERLRRLDLLLVGMSRAQDVQLVDLDRAFALVGARTLGGDYRGQGPLAPAIAAHAIVAALLAAGLDATVPAARQEQAARRNGGREAIAAIVARHLGEQA